MLSAIALDKGRKPVVWSSGKRICLLDRDVSSIDISYIVNKLGGFGPDNKAGLDHDLLKVSAIRNTKQDIIGLTMKAGRRVFGTASMITDLLFYDPTKSILFLGEAGSGKTSVMREAARLLAQSSDVVIVDTTNEIAGGGDIAHSDVGLARRMMVPSPGEQEKVMIECLRNHAPKVMVIDEIRRLEEANAAIMCKERGVRLIASAHGDLRKLIENPEMRDLVGGIEAVKLRDVQARAETTSSRGAASSVQKLVAQRAGVPVFDIIVELRRGAHYEWRVVLDTATAVDSVLAGKKYFCQRRSHNPITGAAQLKFDNV